MMQKTIKYLACIIGAAYVSPALADVTGNVLALASNVTSLITGISFVLGVAMVGGAFIQYRQHKRNRLQVPISKPIVLLILGLVMLVLPLLGHLSKGAQIIGSVPQ